MIRVRGRAHGDAAALVSILEDTHEIDGYPSRLPSDPASFLFGHEVLGTWVADVDGRVCGHVSLRPSTAPAVMELASRYLGVTPESLAVVARLLVAPSCRRLGVGSVLLRQAALAGLTLGRWPVLDVAKGLGGAIALYERDGWRCAGDASLGRQDESALEVHVYVVPTALAEVGDLTAPAI